MAYLKKLLLINLLISIIIKHLESNMKSCARLCNSNIKYALLICDLLSYIKHAVIIIINSNLYVLRGNVFLTYYFPPVPQNGTGGIPSDNKTGSGNQILTG